MNVINLYPYGGQNNNLIFLEDGKKEDITFAFDVFIFQPFITGKGAHILAEKIEIENHKAIKWTLIGIKYAYY